MLSQVGVQKEAVACSKNKLGKKIRINTLLTLQTTVPWDDMSETSLRTAVQSINNNNNNNISLLISLSQPRG